jgi:hypothetical protein
MLFLDEESSKVTSAAEAENLMQLTAGLKACSTPVEPGSSPRARIIVLRWAGMKPGTKIRKLASVPRLGVNQWNFGRDINQV